MRQASRAVLAGWVAFCVVVSGCSTLQPRSSASPPIDIVILTILDPEYDSVLARLEDPGRVDDPQGRHYRWVQGQMESRFEGRPYRIVLGATEDKGEVAGALAARAMISRFRPRHLLLVGIAGGIGGAASLGDVVLADWIWAYELGHLADEFMPETETRFAPDPKLLQAALAVGPEWSRGIRIEVPGEAPRSHVLVGLVGSGNKVIESKNSAIYDDIIDAEPDLVAVEMEGAGAAAAVLDAAPGGYDVGFMMVRAISDLIRENPEGEVREGAKYVDPERERWRDYAADAAAAFTADVIHNHWPFPPR